MDAGADVCVVSVHKMGAGFEQVSVFHLQGDLVDQDRLSACADLLMTTSPNVLVYSALDGWRRHMVEAWARIARRCIGFGANPADGAGDDPDLSVLDDELLRRRGVARPRPHAGADGCLCYGHVGLSGRRLAAGASPSSLGSAITAAFWRRFLADGKDTADRLLVAV